MLNNNGQQGQQSDGRHLYDSINVVHPHQPSGDQLDPALVNVLLSKLHQAQGHQGNPHGGVSQGQPYQQHLPPYGSNHMSSPGMGHLYHGAGGGMHSSPYGSSGNGGPMGHSYPRMNATLSNQYHPDGHVGTSFHPYTSNNGQYGGAGGGSMQNYSSMHGRSTPPASSFSHQTRPMQMMQPSAGIPDHYSQMKMQGPHSSVPESQPRNNSALASKIPGLIDFAVNMAKIDPYITRKVCKDLMQEKFPDLLSEKDKRLFTFSSLMGFYKAVHPAQDTVPPDVLVVLSTISSALTDASSASAEDMVDGDRGVEVMAGSDVSESNLATAHPKKRGRPRKNPSFETTITGAKAMRIICNSKIGLFRLDKQTCDCFCDVCEVIKGYMNLKELDISPKEYERHAGMGHAKKWKSSIFVFDTSGKNNRGKTLGVFMEESSLPTRSITGAHDYLVRMFAKTTEKGIPCSLDESILPDLIKEKKYWDTYGPREHISSPSQQSADIKDTDAHMEAGDEHVQKKAVGRPRKNKLPSPSVQQEAIQEVKSHTDIVPSITSWKVVDESLNLNINVSYGRARFSGVLQLIGVVPGPLPDAQPADANADQGDPTREPPPPMNAPVVSDPPPAADNVAEPSQKKSKYIKKPKSVDAKVDAYQKLFLEGPSPDSTCALCGKHDEPEVPAAERQFFGRCDNEKLGKLILIKVNNASNAWVHDQCARWAPEVHDPTGEGVLVGVRDAIQRGRRLKCKHCGEKGATIGCFSKRCKSSYHLPCARQQCILRGNPYFVCCPEHTSEFFPAGPEQEDAPLELNPSTIHSDDTH